ncbi:hypothetical protein [Acrocarpospora sp. B8E8]|uniref:hypothetical protein n=1 Tax=Acrocarpospora sp. B8E8 TaxID=3153572 RepID=UPI00325DD3ED
MRDPVLLQIGFWSAVLAAIAYGYRRPIRRRPGPPPARRPRLPLRRLLNLARTLPTDLLVKDPPEPK